MKSPSAPFLSPVFAILCAGTFLSFDLQGQFQAIPVLPLKSGVSQPVCMDIAKDGRIFFSERNTGLIKIFDPKGAGLLKLPFAQLFNTDSSGERGLLGLALHPDFPKKPYVFSFQHYKKGSQTLGRITRFTANGNRAIASSIIFDNIPSATIHNGGYLRFGPDKMLYFTVGDNASPSRAQDKSSNVLNGKMHRIQEDGSIPKDNPFGPSSTFFAIGIRNSFGFAFHPLTSKLFEGENGPNTNDELQVLRPGGNYGWPQELGNQNKPGFDKPIHTWTPCFAPCGMDFYGGTAYPKEWSRSLWISDYNKGGIRILQLGGQGFQRVLKETLLPIATHITDVRMGRDGKMYASSLHRNQIYRIDWKGQAPKLPELELLGPQSIPSQNWLTLRGQPSSMMFLLFGPRMDPPSKTPFGSIEVLPLLTFFATFTNPDGIASFSLNIPADPKAQGLRASFQALEFHPTLGLRFSNRVQLWVH
jgi:glucose/arabinose dehydrogenase